MRCRRRRQYIQLRTEERVVLVVQLRALSLRTIGDGESFNGVPTAIAEGEPLLAVRACEYWLPR
jgi:hypothetical protein